MKNVGNSSRGRSQGVPKIQGPHVYGALRGHLCDSTAFLSIHVSDVCFQCFSLHIVSCAFAMSLKGLLTYLHALLCSV